MCEAMCETCFHHCYIKEGKTGLCRARKNENGKIICANYGKITSAALDPIEKKPLKMFFPGTKILSVGSFGCNLNCPFCQNYSISCAGENDVKWDYITPKKLAQAAKSLVPKGNIGVAFTYNEPMVGWEFVRDTAIEVRRNGMKNVVVTNGSVSLNVLTEVLAYIDAFNIDIKGFTQMWYRKLGGDLSQVLDFIEKAASASHVELTALIVPGENDSVGEMEKLCGWIQKTDEKIPLHITRFFPQRLMLDKPPTETETLYRLYDTAKKIIPNVFIGNI